MIDKFPEGENPGGEFGDVEITQQGVLVKVKCVDDIVRFGEKVEIFAEKPEDGLGDIVNECYILVDTDKDGNKHYIAGFDIKETLAGVIDWRKFWHGMARQEDTIVDKYDDYTTGIDGIIAKDYIGLAELNFTVQDSKLFVHISDDTWTGDEKERHSVECLKTLLRAYIDLEIWLRTLSDAEKREILLVEPILHSDEYEHDSEGEGALLEGVYGMYSIENDIREIIASHERPEVMKQYGLKPINSILLTGEPGVGKSLLARALAKKLGAEVRFVKGSDIQDKWVGGSATNVRNIFEEAKACEGKVAIILDEFDGVTFGSGNDGAQNAINSELKDQLSDIYENYPNVIVIATTNDEDKIDPAIRRSGRFDKVLYINKPDEEERQAIIEAEFKALSDCIPELEAEDLETAEIDFTVRDILTSAKPRLHELEINSRFIAQKTEGLTGADIKKVFTEVRMKRALRAATGAEPEPITYEDILIEVEILNR